MSSNWLDNILSPGTIFQPPNLSLVIEKLGSNILDTKKPNFNHFHKKKKEGTWTQHPFGRQKSYL